MSSTNLSVTVAHAIAFLTGPILSTQSAATIIKLHSLLEANLIALYAPTWSVKEPMRGSGRRCLTLSPDCLPPRAIYSACIAAGIQWFDWIAALGGKEFDLFVDPGCVAIKLTSQQMITVWADEVVAPALPTPRTGLVSFNDAQNAAIRRGGFCDGSKTMAQQLLEEDDEDEKIFNMIADEVSGPTWVAPNMTHFGTTTRSPSPLSSISGYSRCSSRSSNSSSSSLSYGSDMLSSASSYASHTQMLPAAEPKQSRREQKPRAARVFIDSTKTEVTPYDGGKTTVLTGGVMLGGGPKPSKKSAVPSANSNSWRSVRV
jgi:BTG family